MASIQSELAKMGLTTPAGGFGLEDLEGRLAELQRTFAQGSRRASAQDQFQLNRRGLGRSVAGAFSQGRRGQQGLEAMLRAMMSLRGQDKQLKNDAYFKQLQAFMPQAMQNANRPSFLSSLLGHIGGATGKAMLASGTGVPGLSSLFGGGDSSPGTGFATSDRFSLGG